MSDSYYGRVRSDIEPLLPDRATRILDVGCGAGGTIGWLKSRYPGAYAIGLEGNAALKPRLDAVADEAHIVDLNGDVPDVGAPDLVLFLDVLEHLARPDRVLATLAARLAKGGLVIVSLPNVAHLSVAWPLFVRGSFEYRDSGILDRTHLRFFTRASALRLISGAGLTAEAGLESGLTGPKTALLDTLTMGLLRDRLSKQYIISAKSKRDAGADAPVRWSIAK
jgi:SAM-dependent methyltransferase